MGLKDILNDLSGINDSPLEGIVATPPLTALGKLLNHLSTEDNDNKNDRLIIRKK